MTVTTNDILVNKIGRTAEQIQENIRVFFRMATPDEFNAGMIWYESETAKWCQDMAKANNCSPMQVAAILSHFSPCNQWAENEKMAKYFVENDGTLYRNYLAPQMAKAIAVWAAKNDDEVLATFTPKSHKTKSFVQNCGGNLDPVTIDTWMLQSLSLTPKELSRVGVYEALAEQFRIVAAEYNIAPAQLQAIIWVHIRGAAH